MLRQYKIRYYDFKLAILTIALAVIGIVALGSAASGIMGNHQPTIDKLIKCANSGCEKMWQTTGYKRTCNY